MATKVQQAIDLVSAVNSVLTLATQLGISMQDLAQLQQQAHAAGRKFGFGDLQVIQNNAQKSLDDLDSAITAAQHQQTSGATTPPSGTTGGGAA